MLAQRKLIISGKGVGEHEIQIIHDCPLMSLTVLHGLHLRRIMMAVHD